MLVRSTAPAAPQSNSPYNTASLPTFQANVGPGVLAGAGPHETHPLCTLTRPTGACTGEDAGAYIGICGMSGHSGNTAVHFAEFPLSLHVLEIG